eukprot:GFYU01007431.1.p1 GENE.GFYU01007431.1~~GFYU01007431.1.p1  ORF type:complete len:129 (-),score=14.66 GFYU01007431.1:239-625(-)
MGLKVPTIRTSPSFLKRRGSDDSVVSKTADLKREKSTGGLRATKQLKKYAKAMLHLFSKQNDTKSDRRAISHLDLDLCQESMRAMFPSSEGMTEDEAHEYFMQKLMKYVDNNPQGFVSVIELRRTIMP